MVLAAGTTSISVKGLNSRPIKFLRLKRAPPLPLQSTSPRLYGFPNMIMKKLFVFSSANF